MLSYQIINYYKLINKELNEFKKVLSPIFEWSEIYLKFATETLAKILKCNTNSGSDGTHYIVREGKIKSEYDNNVKEMKRVFSSYVIFKAFGEFKQKVDHYRYENNITEEDYIQDFISETDNLFETYQEFQKDDINQIKMINFANELMKYKMLFDNTLKMYSDYYLLSTNENKIDEENSAILCVQLLDVDYTMNEFATVLKGINDSYCEIVNLISQNSKLVKYEELKIIKIESGSLFSKVVGEKIIIEILRKILKKAVTWVQANFKQGDKILSHQRFAATLKEDTELMRLLQDCGCDVTNSKENIEKAFNLLSKQSLYLAKSTCNVKIDDEEFKIANAETQKFLKEVKLELLNSGKDMKEDENE